MVKYPTHFYKLLEKWVCIFNILTKMQHFTVINVYVELFKNPPYLLIWKYNDKFS